MQLSYAGVPISLGSAGTKTHNVSVEVVGDATGLDYLHSRYVFDCTGVVNPAMMSFTRQQGKPVVDAKPGQPAALTHAAIRDALSQPRRQLVYSDFAGNVLLQSPATDPNNNDKAFPCDCTGGPLVLRAPEIVQVNADKTLVVRVVISTTINESYLSVSQGPPFLVSNRWSVEETLDDCAFSTLTWRGTAVFRPDIMATKQIVDLGGTKRVILPDDLRRYFANVQILPGYKREQVWVRQQPDGFTVDWQVVDAQRAVTLNDYGAMDVECVVIDGIEMSGAEKYALDGGKKVAGLFDIFNSLAKLKFGEAVGEVVGIGKPLYDALPRWSTRVVITAKGREDSKRRDLGDLCCYVLNAVLDSTSPLLRSFGASAWHLTQDKMGKWVRLEYELRRGPAGSLPISKGAANPNPENFIPADDGMTYTDPDTRKTYELTSDARGEWPFFPGAAGNRGTFLESLVAQVLLNPYQAPPPPPTPPLSGDVAQPS